MLCPAGRLGGDGSGPEPQAHAGRPEALGPVPRGPVPSALGCRVLDDVD